MKLRAVAAVFLSTGILGAADPQLLGLVMPEAKVIAGINVIQAKTSPFGDFLMSQIQADHEDFQRFITATGFDPRRDLVEILSASVGEPGQRSGLVAAIGTFDASRILAMARSTGQTVETYKGVEIASGKHGHQSLAFWNSSIALAGDTETVRGAIDRRTANTPVSLDSALMDKITQLSIAQDAWVVSLVPLSAIGKRMPDPNVQGALQGDLLKSIQQTSGGIKFGPTIQISGEAVAKTDKDATSLADVVKFLASMAQLNAPQNSGVPLTSLLQSLNVITQANTLKLSISIPEEDLERLIRTSEHRASSRRPYGTRRR